MQVSFTIPGEPRGKQRPKWNSRTRTTYTPGETVVYENLVKIGFTNKYPRVNLNGQLRLIIKAYFAIAASTSQKKRNKMLQGEIRPTKKPDVDNITKIVADSLNKIAYADDSQIVVATIEKLFSDNPRVEVIIEEMAESEMEK